MFSFIFQIYNNTFFINAILKCFQHFAATLHPLCGTSDFKLDFKIQITPKALTQIFRIYDLKHIYRLCLHVYVLNFIAPNKRHSIFNEFFFCDLFIHLIYYECLFGTNTHTHMPTPS